MSSRRNLAVISLCLIMLVSCICLIMLTVTYVLRSPFGTDHVPRIFGATYMTMDNQYFEVLNSFIEEIVESNGDRLITRDPANNQSKQNDQILDMLDLGVECIFINAVDYENICPALEECRKRNVPFINIDTNTAYDAYAASVISSDNYNAGVLIGKDLAAKRKEARIVILYDDAISSTKLRFQGFLDAISESSMDYSIVYTASNTTLLHDTMVEIQSFLDLGLRFDVVFGSNDPAALGALAAIQNNRVGGDVLIYGIDGSPSAKMMVQQGYMEGTVAQFPSRIAKISVQAAYDCIEGKDVQKTIIVPVEMLTRQNVEEYNIMGWQ